MTKRVLVLWADEESSNLGVRVLGQGAAALARRAWGPETVIDFQSFSYGPLQTQLSGKIVLKGLLTANRDLRRRMEKYDAVIDTGAGDSFTDIYGLKRLAIMFYTRFVAQKSSVPVILAPQTIGPFETRVGRFLAKRTLRFAHSVMARDSVSMEFAKGLGPGADCLATDVIFALEQPPAPASSTADVVLNVSGLLWSGDAHVSKDKYQSLTRELIEQLLAAGRSVTLMAHVLDNPSPDNDVAVIRKLAAEFPDRVTVFIPKDLEDVRRFIGGCSVVIGARMHACLNALSVGKPAIPLAYSRKFAPLLADIGWPHTLDLRSDEEIVRNVMALLDGGQLSADADSVRAKAEERLNAAVGHLTDQVGVRR
ncbi:polysaccharide pyruvyl transferase family protein [Arthrobacter sp. NPDC056493]|uniref:polysaccharide pyruvyl transferase family protein n=1 Tax=Arthrobacter sp. NPDC056493 TaxID=3345839 RepID=UPI0036729D44